LQTIHILTIAMVLSSVFMIDLRVPRITRSQSIANRASLCAVDMERCRPACRQRHYPDRRRAATRVAQSGVSDQDASPCGGHRDGVRLSNFAAFWSEAQSVSLARSVFAVSTFLLWCMITLAGRLIAYMQVG
jgi:hypothetical protein